MNPYIDQPPEGGLVPQLLPLSFTTKAQLVQECIHKAQGVEFHSILHRADYVARCLRREVHAMLGRRLSRILAIYAHYKRQGHKRAPLSWSNTHWKQLYHTCCRLRDTYHKLYQHECLPLHDFDVYYSKDNSINLPIHHLRPLIQQCVVITRFLRAQAPPSCRQVTPFCRARITFATDALLQLAQQLSISVSSSYAEWPIL